MSEFINNLSSLEKGYFYIGLAATVFFILQTVFSFLDIGDHADSDFDSVDGHDSALGGVGLSINLLTLRGIVGFLMIFGWAGISFSKAGYNPFLVFIFSFICGFIMMVIIALIYFFVLKLGESGNIDLHNAVGKQCEVYIPIPANNSGIGKVQIILNDSLREIEAVTNQGLLKSGEVVKVVSVLNDKLVVEKIN